MTYWPISSPSVFAATKQTNPERTYVSHDGVEHKKSGDEDDAQIDAEGEASMQGNGGVKEEPGAQRLQGSIEEDIHGEIIAVRITRSGHMFATLTRSTLTIWQTKACWHRSANSTIC
jgi:hypothetical protein